MGNTGNLSTNMASRFSESQAALIQCGAGQGRRRVVVKAYAGSGKTHGLIGLAESEFTQGRKGLYLAFNKSAQLEAAKRFGNTAKCSTTHSLAYHATRAFRYNHKMTGITPMAVMLHCGFNPNSDWAFSRRVCEVVEKFLASADPVMPSAQDLISRRWAQPQEAARLSASAKVYWLHAIDPDHPAPISHDVYLKLYQLSKPAIDAPYIMLDEAQDTTDCVLDIIDRQQCPVILVGDPYQSIYAFRGAIDAMKKMTPDAVFEFKESYRFGAKVAKVANALLWGFFSESSELIGAGVNTQIGTIPLNAKRAFLSRGNAALFEQALIALTTGDSFGFVGGAKNYDFWSIVDTWHLQSGERELVRNPLIKAFSNISEMLDYANQAGDRDLQRFIKIVGTYGEEVTVLVPEIYATAVDDLAKCNLILSTAHKSKGATLDCVILADDFPPLVDSDGEPLPASLLDRQEVHLLYVALTRASLALQLNETTWDFLRAMGISRTILESVVDLSSAEFIVSPKKAVEPIAPQQQGLF
jgi:F-box protein, helicase, 18